MARAVQDQVFFQDKLPDYFIHMWKRQANAHTERESIFSIIINIHMELIYMSSTKHLLQH